MDEQSLTASILTYKEQLQQVDLAIQAAGDTEELTALKSDLQELIKLTEESLLSLKKSELLRSLDATSGEGNSTEKQSGERNDIDSEYAAFQAMLGDDVTGPSLDQKSGTSLSEKASSASPVSHSSVSSVVQASSTSVTESAATLNDLYSDIVGTKCRAPYSHDWGSLSHYNALIVSIEDGLEDEDLPKVRVMFTHPTHSSMQPCKYYLENKCHFNDDNCRFSHGCCVDLSDLQEYLEPDFSSLKIGHRCLARYEEDDLWYKATVHDLHSNDTGDNGDDDDDDKASHKVTVTFDDYDETVVVDLEDILPLDRQESDESEGEESEEDALKQPINREESDEEEELPVFLWKPPPKGGGNLGDWEQHTKGIGSKLMAKMGYVPGEGLGCRGNGRVQPVPIQLLPKGKSLDTVMQLKAIAGEQDLFDVLKKREKMQKKESEKQVKAYEKSKTANVFDFINKKLGGKKGKLSELVHRHHGNGHGHHKGEGHRHISESDLSKKSGRCINVQLLKTSEEMKSVRKELSRLKQSLARNENRDRSMAAQARHKITSLEQYLEKLQASEQTMERHQKKRTDHKKFTVF